MRLSLDPSESESLRATGGIEPAHICYFKAIDDHHRLIVVETVQGGYYWAIMGPVGVDRMSVEPADMLAVALFAGQGAMRDFVEEVAA